MTKHSWYGSELDDDDRRQKDNKLSLGASTYTFRVDEQLKQDFVTLCQKQRYSASAALRRYMLRCVEKGEVTHDFSKLKKLDGETLKKLKKFRCRG